MKENQRQNQKNQTRKNIINTALKEFAENGFMATATSNIAKAAKVSHGTIFAHFSTREILLDEVIEEFGIRITKKLHELSENNGCIEEALKTHLLGIMEYETFYMRLISEISLLHESARKTLIMIQSTVSFHLFEIVEKERNKNKIIEVPFNMLFNMWIGLIHYYLMNSDLFATNQSVLSRYGDELIQNYIKMISCEGR